MRLFNNCAEHVVTNTILDDDNVTVLDNLNGLDFAVDVVNALALFNNLSSNRSLSHTAIRKSDRNNLLVGVTNGVEVVTVVNCEVVQVGRDTNEVLVILNLKVRYGAVSSVDDLIGLHVTAAADRTTLTYEENVVTVEFDNANTCTTVRSVRIDVILSGISSSSVELEVNSTSSAYVAETALVNHVSACTVEPETTIVVHSDTCRSSNRNSSVADEFAQRVSLSSCTGPNGIGTNLVASNSPVFAIVAGETGHIHIQHDNLEVFAFADNFKTAVDTGDIVAVSVTHNTVNHGTVEDWGPGLEVFGELIQRRTGVVLHRNEDTTVFGDTNTIRSVGAGATVAHTNGELKAALESTVVTVGDRLESRVERIDTVLVNRGVVALVRSVLYKNY